MKNILCLFVFALTAIPQINAQMVMGTETFDGTTFAPTGWRIITDSTPTALNIWRRLTSGTNPTCNPKGGAAMARFTSRAYIAGSKQQLVSRAINYSNRGTSPANITFWMYRDSINTNYDSMTVWVNNADSLNANALKLGTICRYRGHMIPDTQSANGWYQYSFGIPTSYSGNMTTHFIFEGTSQTPVVNQGAQMFIDQLNFEEYPMPCSGTPNAGNIVIAKPLICGGTGNSNLTLSAPLAVSGLSYQWQSAPSASGPWTNLATTANANTGTISSTTFYNCTITCSNSTLNYTTPIDSVIVSTNPNPTLAISPSPAILCPGATGVSITASGASTYTWSPVTTLNASTGATVVATPTGNTQYTIVGTDANGCTGTTTVNATIGTAPNLSMSATPNDSMCSGSQVILNCMNGNPGNNTFLWSTGATTRRDTILVTASAMYSVAVTNTAGCVAKDSIYITVLPPQTSGFTYTQVGNTFSFVDTTTGGVSWKWTLPGGLFSNSKTVDFTFGNPGTYTITLVVNGPCKLDTISKTITVLPLGINDMSNTIQIACYPNPAHNILHLDADKLIMDQITITNNIGQQVLQQNTNATIVELNIAQLPTGIYQAAITTAKGNSRIVFVKE